MAKIIVVDDVLDACILLKKILERKGHEVFTFTEEEDAVGFVKKHYVDLAILDIKLKRLSGIDLLAILKEIRPDLNVIILTGYPTIETAKEALNKGAKEYLVKPVDKAELEQAVDSVLSTGRP